MDHTQPQAASEETRMLRDLVAKFVERDLMPLEPAILKREATGGGFKLSEEEEKTLLARCQELGLWGLLALCLRAFCVGAGTYTGIEAVSNGLPVLRAPPVRRVRRCCPLRGQKRSGEGVPWPKRMTTSACRSNR